MKTFRRILFLLVLLAVLVFWTVFTVYNPGPLNLTLLGWQSIALPISLWLLASFALGGLAGVLLCISGYLKGKAVQKQLRAELERSQAGDDTQNQAQVVQSNRSRPMSADHTSSDIVTTN